MTYTISKLQRRITAFAGVVAPALLLTSTIAYLVRGEGMNDGQVGGAIQFWALATYAVAGVGLSRILEPRAPRAAVVLTVLTLVGAAGGVAYGIDSIQVELFGAGSIQESGSAVAPFALQIPGIIFPLAFAALGFLLARTRAVSGPAGYVLAAGMLLFPVGRIPDIPAVAIAGDVLVLAALSAISAKVYSGHAGE